jgi:hypothetical protein
MLQYSMSDVLSPRELRRQIVRYFLFSMLFWVLFTVVGGLFFLDLEVVPGKSLSLFTSPRLVVAFAWRLFVFSCLSAGIGFALALPSVFLVWMANTGSAFSNAPRKNTVSLGRGAAVLFPLVLSLFLNLFALAVSVSASPILASRIDGGQGIFWKPANALYDLFYEEPASEIAKGWRKSFLESETELLVVMLPAKVLKSPQNFPLLTKELGAPIPFFLTAPSLENQVDQVLGVDNGGESLPALFHFSNNGARKFQSNDVHLALASEYGFAKNPARPPSETSGGERVSAVELLSQRFALTQPHLGFLGRSGFLGALFEGMEWDSIDADDSFTLSRFLHTVQERPKARVRFLQLSSLGTPDVLKALHPRRYPKGIEEEISRDALKVFDLKLGRALGAIRQNRKLSVVVLPYPERLSRHEFSNMFVRFGESIPPGFEASLRSKNAFAIVSDVSSLRHLGGAPSEVEAPSADFRCQRVRISPELLREEGESAHSLLLSDAYSFVSPKPWDVLFVPQEVRFFAADLNRIALFCREYTLEGAISRLVVWNGENGVSFSERTGFVIGEHVLSYGQSSPAKASREFKKRDASETGEKNESLQAPLSLNKRLSVFLVSPQNGVVLDAAAASFLESRSSLIRSVFANAVLNFASE